MLYFLHSALFLTLAVQLTTASSWFEFDSLTPRHDSHEHHDPQGTGHGQNMSHGAFNFTPSGIPVPRSAIAREPDEVVHREELHRVRTRRFRRCCRDRVSDWETGKSYRTGG